MITSYFNPRSPCGERRMKMQQLFDELYISIHAPRAGSDRVPILPRSPASDFNPRSPCGERPHIKICGIINIVFQSTLPVRGATTSRSYQNVPRNSFQSTLPVRGATSLHGVTYHAIMAFQSTLPVRGATITPLIMGRQIYNFNPRSPCGERQ